MSGAAPLWEDPPELELAEPFDLPEDERWRGDQHPEEDTVPEYRFHRRALEEGDDA